MTRSLKVEVKGTTSGTCCVMALKGAAGSFLTSISQVSSVLNLIAPFPLPRVG